jgi:hypothetical protein
MNVYEKLQLCRVALQEMGLKKSGNNKFAGYTYFELSDFLPSVNTLCKANGLFTLTTFHPDVATLEVINSEKPEERIVFTSPMAEAALKGCHAIQNVGAVQTYQRRYLMMVAFEIVEADGLDAVTGKDEKKSVSKEGGTLTEKQIKRLYAIAYHKGYGKDKVDEQVFKRFGVKVNALSKEQYDQVVAGYEKSEGRYA